MRHPSSLTAVVLATVVFALSAVPTSAAAAGTKRLRESAAGFLAGELDGLILDAQGRLLPAPVGVTAYPTDAFYVWSVAEDAKGRIVAGTGDAGTIYRQDGDALVPWAKTLALEILCFLTVDGDLLAGSSPDGVVYRIDDDGSVEVALDVPQQSIWDLALAEGGDGWIAATGPGARLVRVTNSQPAGEVLHELAATNATALLRDGSTLWVATQGPGLLFRIDGGDATEPLLVYEAAEEEIRSLVSDGDGGVIVLSVRLDNPAPATATPKKNGNKSGAPAADVVHGRITWHPRDGGVETIYEGPEKLLSLARLPDGDLLAGEAEKGRVLRIDPEGRRSLWVDLEESDPLALTVRDDGTCLVGTGNLGKVFALEGDAKDEGTFTSQVLHAPHNAQWGRLWVEGQTEDVRVQTRSGVRKRPDESWSKWGGERAVGAELDAPVAPYVQYRLITSGSESEMGITAVELAYRERNLAPRIGQVRVEPSGGDLSAGRLNGSPDPVSQRFDDGLGVEYSLYRERQKPGDELTAWARGLRSVLWKGEDPNQDALRYRIEVRRLPDGEWMPLASAHRERVYAWDTRSVEDGTYRLRITADDGADNPAQDQRVGSAMSTPVHVDNTPPRVRDASWNDEIEVDAEDQSSPLRSVSVRLDEGEWQPLEPLDGVLDDRRERFRFAPPQADRAGGASRVWLRLVDAAGNVRVEELDAN